MPVSSALGVVLGGGINLNAFNNSIGLPGQAVNTFIEHVQKIWLAALSGGSQGA
jgi:hypothetical protein